MAQSSHLLTLRRWKKDGVGGDRGRKDEEAGGERLGKSMHYFGIPALSTISKNEEKKGFNR